MECKRTRAEIEEALEAAEQAFEGFKRIAESMAGGHDHDYDPAYFRAVEDRAVGHGAIVHILQWILNHHDDRGIDQVSITEVQPGVTLVRVFHASGDLTTKVCLNA